MPPKKKLAVADQPHVVCRSGPRMHVMSAGSGIFCFWHDIVDGRVVPARAIQLRVRILPNQGGNVAVRILEISKMECIGNTAPYTDRCRLCIDARREAIVAAAFEALCTEIAFGTDADVPVGIQSGLGRWDDLVDGDRPGAVGTSQNTSAAPCSRWLNQITTKPVSVPMKSNRRALNTIFRLWIMRVILCFTVTNFHL